MLMETDRVLRYSEPSAKFPAVASILVTYGIDPVQFAEAVMAQVAHEGAAVEAQAVQVSQEQAAAAFREQRAKETALAMSRMSNDQVNYPHYDAVAPAISATARQSLDRGETPDVSRLYTEAAWSNPDCPRCHDCQ